MKKPLKLTKPVNEIIVSKPRVEIISKTQATLPTLRKAETKTFGFQEIRRAVEWLKQPEMPQNTFNEEASEFFEQLKAKLLENNFKLEEKEFYTKGPLSHSFVEHAALSPAILSTVEIPHPTFVSVQLGKKPRSTEILLMLHGKIDFASEDLKKALANNKYETKDVIAGGDWFDVSHKGRKIASFDGSGITFYAPHTSSFTPEFEEHFKTIYDLIMSQPHSPAIERKSKKILPPK